MIRPVLISVVLVLPPFALAASAQDFTTQDPRYTTTPPEYTTTPPQYTTTPPQYTTTPLEYTTTPPAYVPQADTVPSDPGPTTPTFPNNPNLPPGFPGGGNIPDNGDPDNEGGLGDGTGTGTDSTVGSTMFMPNQLGRTGSSTTPSSQQIMQPRTIMSSGQQPAPIESSSNNVAPPAPVAMPTAAPNGTNRVIGLFAEVVLQLDENGTQQFVSDYEEVVAELELEPSEVSVGISVRIALYLTLREKLGLSGAPMAAGGEIVLTAQRLIPMARNRRPR